MAFNVLFTDLFNESNGLLDTVSPGNWLAGNASFPAVILSETCTVESGNNVFDAEWLEAIAAPADQWASVTFTNWNLSLNETGGYIYLRAGVYGESGISSGYAFRVESNGNGETATVEIAEYTSFTILYNNDLLSVAPGDTFLVACQGTTLSFYHNGTLLTSITNSVDASGSISLSYGINSSSGHQSDIGLTNFQAGNFSYSISGNVGVAGATVSYTGTSSGSVVADGSGNYSIVGLLPGSYTITPSAEDYSFAPTSQNETVSDSDIAGVNFTPTQTAFSIGGNVGAPNALVSYTGTASGFVTADGSGNFEISGLDDGSYTITPTLANFVFSPTSQNETISGSNITAVDFTATEYFIEDWMSKLGFTDQIDLINDANYAMPYRVGAAALVKMQVTYRIYLNNTGAYGQAHYWNNPNPQWQIDMVARQSAQTEGFAAIYASAPLLPNPTPPFVYPTY
jgi:hypothetical protein